MFVEYVISDVAVIPKPAMYWNHCAADSSGWGTASLQGGKDCLELRGCLIRDAVGCAVGVATEVRSRGICRWLAIGPLVESDDRGVEVGHVAGVVEDDRSPGGEELVEVGVRGHLGLLQQPVQTLEDHGLVGRQFGVDLGPQRLDVTEVRIAHVWRDPVARRLGDHPAQHADGCGLR